MKIERRVAYNSTIHAEVYAVSYLFYLISYFLFIPSCPRVLVSHHTHQSTIIWLGNTRLGSAWLGGDTAMDGATATAQRRGMAWRYGNGVRWRLLEGEGRRERGKGRRDGYTTARDGTAFVRWEVICQSF